MAGLSLLQQMERMPQELRDAIHNLVFTAPLLNPASRTARIDRDYKPPSLLQVDRASRAAHQDAYYSTTTFVIADPNLGRRWARSLTDEQFARVRRIRYALRPQERTLRSTTINRSRVRDLARLLQDRGYACTSEIGMYSAEVVFRRDRGVGRRRSEYVRWRIEMVPEGVLFTRRW